MSNELTPVKIIYDDDPLDPRDLDPATTIVCWHKRANLGDENLTSLEEINAYYDAHRLSIDWAKAHGLFHEIFLYEHGGYAFNLGDYGNWPDIQWDAEQVGFIYVIPEKARRVLGHKRLTQSSIKQLKAALEGEYTAWKNFFENQTYCVLDVNSSATLFLGTYQDCADYVAADDTYKLIEED